MSFLSKPGNAIGVAVILFGISLALPYADLGMFGWDFSEMPTSVVGVIQAGLIILGFSIAIRPLNTN